MTATAVEVPSKAPTGSAARKEMPDKLPLMERALPAEEIRLVKGDDGFTRITFPCSSETPVERWYGEEVLAHESDSIRLERVDRGACPLLFNHDMDDPIGMVTGARIERKRLVVDAKLFKTPRAAEIESMIDGGLRNVSLLYRIHVSEEDVKKQRYTHTDWEPYEVSIVTVPADATVGIGRSQAAGDQFEVRMLRTSPDVSETTATQVTAPEVVTPAQPAKIGDRSMPDVNEAAAGSSAERTAPRVEAGQQQEHPNAVQMEKDRRSAIENLCKANKLDQSYQDLWIRSGHSMRQVSEDLLAILEERGRTNPQSPAKLGLTNAETQQFSLRRAIIASVDKDWSKAGFELDCSRAIAQKLGHAPDPKKFYVPFEVLGREVPSGRRDLTTSVPGAAGYLVATENQGFIEVLRNRSVAFRMGARRLSGLQGNVTIPRQSGTGTAYWLGTEASQVTESNQAFQQIAMTPKTVSAYTEISRNLLMQSSPSAEGIVTDDLGKTVAVAADLAVLNGSGASGQPLGIIGTTGIGTVSGTSFTKAAILEFQTDVATSNVEPVRGGYVTTPAVAGLASSRVEFSGSQKEIWVGNIWDGVMAGFPAMSSNQMPAGTMLFGDWQEVVVAEWGVLEVEVNPYANFTAGILGVRAMYSLDVGVRRAFAFSYGAAMT
jgi:HK97 family phage major capsid protein/HK97 family phage prohead protease